MGNSARQARSVNRLDSQQFDSLVELADAKFIDGYKYQNLGFYPSTEAGGGVWVARANYDLTKNNGGTVVSVAALQAWRDAAIAAGGLTTANLQSTLAANLFPAGTGTGDAYVRIDDPRSIQKWGVKANDSGANKVANAAAFQQAVDQSETSFLREVLYDFTDADFEGDVYWRSYVKGVGSGRGGLLRFTDGALKVDGAENGQHVTNWELQSFTLERQGTVGPALHLTGDGTPGSNKGAIRFKIDNVAIDGSTGEGYLMQNTYIGDVFSPLIRNCADAGIKVRLDDISSTVGVNTVNFYAGEIQQCGRGYDLQNVSSMTFYGTAVEGNDAAALIGTNVRNFSHIGGYYELNGSLASDRDVIIGDAGASPVSVVFDNVVFWDGAGAVKDHAIELVKCQEFDGRNLTFNAYETSGFLNSGGGSLVTGRYSAITVNTSGVESTGDTFLFRKVTDELYLTGSRIFDVPSIADGATYEFTITVTDLSADDFVVDVSTATSLQGMTIYAESRSGFVNVVLTNNTGAAVDLANTTWRALCLPRSAFI